MLFRFAVILTFGLTAFSSATAQYSFTDLSSAFPDGADVMGLSPDGATVLGAAPNGIIDQFEPMYYRDGKITILPLATYPGNGDARRSAADGTIVGQVRVGSNETFGDAAVWRNGALSLLEHAPGGNSADARGISADGHVIVGRATLANFDTQAARWVDGHIEPLGDIPGSDRTGGNALAVSADGSVIVGEAGGSDTAFRWMNGTMEALPLINGSDIQASIAFDISADGRRIVGEQNHFNFLSDALLWEDGVPRNLGYLPGSNRSFPYAISADGELVFGESGSSFSNFRAFV